LSRELVEWADLIVVMEKQHRAKVQTRFRTVLRGTRIVCLNIPDNYAFMEPALVTLLEARVAHHLPRVSWRLVRIDRSAELPR
jgi:predicted protein tyrosine phosphatase